MSRKIYYSIGEVSEKLGLETHVLRFWETEFSELKPEKNRAGNRAYRDKDVEIAEKIQFLLHSELFTIEGARKKLKALKKISLSDYQRSQALMANAEFVVQLQQILGM